MLSLARNRLETDRLVLRRPLTPDAEPIAALANDARIANRLATMPHPYGKDDALTWIKKTALAGKGSATFLICLKTDDNPIVGTFGYGPREDTGDIEIGYWIAAAHWGSGYATEAGHAMITHAFCLSMTDRLSADAQLDNIASLRVLEKLGFRVIGERSRFSEALGREVRIWRATLGYETWLHKQAA